MAGVLALLAADPYAVALASFKRLVVKCAVHILIDEHTMLFRSLYRDIPFIPAA